MTHSIPTGGVPSEGIELRESIQSCSSLWDIKKYCRYYYYYSIKLHKPGTPIRPVINWKNASAYELAKLLQNHLQLPYTYNIQDSKTLMTELETIEMDKNSRICSFDIKNMYTNIPRTETANLIYNILKTNQNINDSNQKEILHTLDTIMEQSYFQFQQKCFKQTEGLAMGAPTSAILAETYIQNMEQNKFTQYH
jgi:hypothetical protein